MRRREGGSLVVARCGRGVEVLADFSFGIEGDREVELGRGCGRQLAHKAMRFSSSHGGAMLLKVVSGGEIAMIGLSRSGGVAMMVKTKMNVPNGYFC